MYRLVEQDCPDDTKGNGKRYDAIPATQRTNNSEGYAMDITPWSTDNQMWIKMEAYTPRLEANSIFEMYAAIQDTWDTSRTMFDTVKCAVEFWLDADGNSTNPAAFSIGDYVSTLPLFLITTDGTSETSVASYLDTANNGSSDWFLSPVQEENAYICNQSYCKF